MVQAVSNNVFLKAVALMDDDVWNGDGRGAERAQTMLDAIRDLPLATVTEDAQALYWQIDNVAVIQGSLFPAGPKILPGLVGGLFLSTQVSRPFLLEAIYQVAAGWPDPQLSIYERERIQTDMVRLVAGVTWYFIYLIVHGSDEEALHAVNLLALIITAPRRLPIVTPINDQELNVLLEGLKALNPHRHDDLSSAIAD